MLSALEERASIQGDVCIRSIVLMVGEAPSSADGGVVLGDSDVFQDNIRLWLRSFETFARSERVAEFVRALAHEFRHLDQGQHWDLLPGVGPAAAYGSSSWTPEVYLADPGEKDARDFSDEFLAAAGDDVLQSIRGWLRDTVGSNLPEHDVTIVFKGGRPHVTEPGQG